MPNHPSRSSLAVASCGKLPELSQVPSLGSHSLYSSLIQALITLASCFPHFSLDNPGLCFPVIVLTPLVSVFRIMVLIPLPVLPPSQFWLIWTVTVWWRVCHTPSLHWTVSSMGAGLQDVLAADVSQYHVSTECGLSNYSSHHKQGKMALEMGLIGAYQLLNY